MVDAASVAEDLRPLRQDAMLEALGVVALLLLAEGLILLQQPEVGLVVHAGTIIALLGLVQRATPPAALLFQALILVPILRIFNLGIPPFVENQLLFLTIIYLFIGLSTVLIIRSQGLTATTLGLTPRQARLVVPGLVIGLVIGIGQYSLALEDVTYSPSLLNYALVIITTGLLVGLVEEIIFRGLVQRWLIDLSTRWIGVVITSVLFGFMHSVWLAPLDVVFAGVVSLGLGWAYAVNNNLWFITSIHAAINIGAFLLGPLVL